MTAVNLSPSQLKSEEGLRVISKLRKNEIKIIYFEYQIKFFVNTILFFVFHHDWFGYYKINLFDTLLDYEFGKINSTIGLSNQKLKRYLFKLYKNQMQLSWGFAH